MKKMSRTYMLDTAHLWSVRGLMGLTLFGCATMTLQVYNYFQHVRPLKQKDQQMKRELDMTIEQEEKEAELLRKQQDAERLTT